MCNKKSKAYELTLTVQLWNNTEQQSYTDEEQDMCQACEGGPPAWLTTGHYSHGGHSRLTYR